MVSEAGEPGVNGACAFAGCQSNDASRWLTIGGDVVALCDKHASGLLRSGVITTHADQGRPRCLFCDKAIPDDKPGLTRPYHASEIAKRKFCDVACSAAYKRATARNERITKACRFCGTPLEPHDDEPFYLFRQKVYCDLACYSAHRAEQKQRRRGLV